MGALRRDARGADHRPRRGLLRLRRARQPLPRRALRRCSASTPATAAPSSARRWRARSRELDFVTNWSYAHPRAIELAARIAELAPGDLNRVFFTSGGSRGGRVGAQALPRNYHRVNGKGQQAQGDRPRDRLPRHHAGRALRRPGSPTCATPFEPLAPGGCHVPNTNSYRWPEDRDPLWAAEQIEERIEFEGPETVAAVILEPRPERRRLHPAAGGLLPARPRDLRPARRPADLRRGDLLLGPARPLLRLRALRLPARHHHHGQGADLGLRADGGDDRLRPGRRAVHARAPRCSPTASPSPAIRWPPRWRWPTSTSSSARTSAATCSRKEGEFRAMLEGLRDIPIVGDVRGAGYFQAIELVKDKETKESFDDEESEELLRGFLSGELYRRGLICRADDRGDPVIQLAPPLIADTEQFEEIERDPARRPHRGLEPDRQRTEAGGAPMLTVRSLARRDAASSWPPATDAAERPVRWVHISELEDPTPWLSGGELLLTTGHPARRRAAKQRAFVARLAGDEPRRARLRHRLRAQPSCRRRWSRRPRSASFPLFEVPYEMPFIAITEKAFARLVNEQYDVLAARDRGARAARAAGARGARARRDRRARSPPASAARCRPRRRAASARQPRVPAQLSERGARGGPRRDPRRGSERRRRTPSRRTTPRSPAGRSRCRCPRRAAAPPQAWLVVVARRRRARRLRAADPPAGARSWSRWS